MLAKKGDKKIKFSLLTFSKLSTKAVF